MNTDYAQTLSELIQCRTVSYYGQTDKSCFYEFHGLLRKKFPNIFAACDIEDFDGSLLLRWKGKNSAEKPLLLMSHHDVVDAQGQWTHPPFSGDIADGFVWGRGTLDTKGNLWAMLQAADELAEQGFVPARDVYFESACTEETDGTGADNITKALEERGIEFFMVLDEGGMIMHDPIGGANGDFAMIGVGEKSVSDVKFIARSGGGHASTPPKDTPLVRLGKFMAEVERSHIFKAHLTRVTREMLRRMSPYVKGALHPVFAHPNLFAIPLKLAMPAVSPTAGAMLKTTVAFTMASGSLSTNSIPNEAWVVGNMRFSHHQGIEGSMEAITKIAKKYDIDIEILDPGFFSHLSDYNGEAFRLVEDAVGEVFPGVVPTPYIMTGASDCRYFSRVCRSCFRFAPFKIDDRQLESIHGSDENVGIDTLEPAVRFFRYIIEHI